MAEIRRIGRDPIRLKKLFGERTHSQTPEGASRLLYRRSPNEEYSTSPEGHLLINGMDILSLIDGEEVDVELLTKLFEGVYEYRQYVWAEYGTDYRHFNAQTQGILEKGLNKLGRSYESMSGGIKVRLASGRLWVNDIDPKVVLALFLSNPTEERRRYLQSIQMKLALILEGKAGNGHSDAVVEETKRLFVQVTKAFENTQAARTPPLLANFNPVGR